MFRRILFKLVNCLNTFKKKELVVNFKYMKIHSILHLFQKYGIIYSYKVNQVNNKLVILKRQESNMDIKMIRKLEYEKETL